MCGQWKQITLALLLCSLSALAVNAQDKTPATSKVTGNVVTLADGYTFEADEVWKQGDETWYRKGNINQLLPKEKVKKIERNISTPTPSPSPAPVQSSNDDDHFEVSEVVAQSPPTSGVLAFVTCKRASATTR